MSSENLHAPRERLSRATLNHHHAIISVMEEMDAVDWYRQRAEDTEDDALREVLLHNMREEIEHACMVLEWLRRNDSEWAKQMDTYLYTEAAITEIEEVEEGRKSDDAIREIATSGTARPGAEAQAGKPRRRFTIGDLKGRGDRR